MSLPLHRPGTDGVERAHEADARQELGRGDPGPLGQRLRRHGSVASRIGIAAVDDHLALHQGRVVLAHLGERRVGHRDENHLAKLGGLCRKAGARLGAGPLHQLRELLGMAGGEEDLVSGLRPLEADRAPYVSRPDDPDPRGRLPRPGCSEPSQQERRR